MIRFRQSTHEWCMSFDAFRAMDYGKVCAQLGLRPSKPSKPKGKR
jgi:hypothetical protein